MSRGQAVRAAAAEMLFGAAPWRCWHSDRRWQRSTVCRRQTGQQRCCRSSCWLKTTKRTAQRMKAVRSDRSCCWLNLTSSEAPQRCCWASCWNSAKSWSSWSWTSRLEPELRSDQLCLKEPRLDSPGLMSDRLRLGSSRSVQKLRWVPCWSASWCSGSSSTA